MIVKKQKVILSYFLAELLLLNFAFFALSFIRYGVLVERTSYFLLIAIYNFAWTLIVFINGPEDLYIRTRFRKRVKIQLRNLFLLVGIVSPLILLVGEDYYARSMVFGPPLLFFVLNFIAFDLAGDIIGFYSNKEFRSRVLILGAESRGKQVLDFTQRNKHLGYEVVGFLDDDLIGKPGLNVLGKIKDLPSVLEQKSIDEIVIAMPTHKEQDIQYAIKTADFNGIRVNVVPDYWTTFGSGYRAYNMDEIPVLEREIPLDKFHNFLAKRMFDIIFATLMLIALSPILLVLAILIKLDSRGPIFYRPVRKGQNGKEFDCLKFRTMYVDKCEDPRNGSKSTQKNDPRITRIGRILRKKDLDELPQFINVLKGDMSVVGPRPHRVRLNTELQNGVDSYMIRHYVKPGITGWAQVNGWRGPTETKEQKEERVKHDLWYIHNWTFFLDLKIVFLTAFGRKTRINAF